MIYTKFVVFYVVVCCAVARLPYKIYAIYKLFGLYKTISHKKSPSKEELFPQINQKP